MALMVLVMATDAQAETLYDREGIQLQGTARIVTYEAGVCRVLEESETKAAYEKTKANHGQPLHVWQLNFSAYNGTGKALSFLAAHFKIESEWPPCTNWSGPEGSYAKPVEWAGSFQVLQKPYGIRRHGQNRNPGQIYLGCHLSLCSENRITYGKACG